MTTQTWPKNAWWKCPKCVRHFMGALAAKQYDGRCNLCDTKIHWQKDRVK